MTADTVSLSVVKANRTAGFTGHFAPRPCRSNRFHERLAGKRRCAHAGAPPRGMFAPGAETVKERTIHTAIGVAHYRRQGHLAVLDADPLGPQVPGEGSAEGHRGVAKFADGTGQPHLTYRCAIDGRGTIRPPPR
jgi:hypothetical protein